MMALILPVAIAFFARAQGQGYLHPFADGDILMMPVSIAQCETFSIFYSNFRNPFFLALSTVDVDLSSNSFLVISFPPGTGYLEWICDIPSGELFTAFGGVTYAVQPGSSACLGDLTTTYSLASYNTSIFRSYTATTPSYFGSFASTLSSQFSIQSLTANYPTSAYPTGSFTTITVNPNIGVVSTSFTTIPSATASSTTIPPATASSTTHKSNGTVIAGAVVGAVIFILLALTLIFFYWRKSRKSAAISLPVESDPTVFPYVPTPAIPLPESTEYIHRHPFLSPNAGISQTKPLRNAPPTAVPEPLISTYPSPEVSPSRSRETPSDLSAALDVVSRATPSQRQAFLSSLNASANVVGDLSPPNTPMPMPPGLTSMTNTQNHPPDLTTVLGIISDAHLTQRERQIVASFTNSLAANPSTPANLTRENTVSPPPQYSG